MAARKFVPLLALGLGALGVACGSDSELDRPGGAAGSPGEMGTWSEVRRTEACTPPDNAPLCIDDTLRVRSDGRFLFEKSRIDGRLSESETSDLSETARDVSLQELSTEICTPVEMIPEISRIVTGLTRSQGTEIVVLDVSAERGKCVKGSESLADELDLKLQRIMQDHAPNDPCFGIPLPSCPPACPADYSQHCGEPCAVEGETCGNNIGDGRTCVEGRWACLIHPPLSPDHCNLVCR
jgi:hypothetical protein